MVYERQAFSQGSCVWSLGTIGASVVSDIAVTLAVVSDTLNMPQNDIRNPSGLFIGLPPRCRVYLTGSAEKVETAKKLLTSIANDTLGA